MIRKSFTLRILALSFLLLALPLLVYSFTFFQKSYHKALEDAKTDLREIVNYKKYAILLAQPVKQVLLDELIYLLDLGEWLENPQRDQEALTRMLFQIVHTGGDFSIFVLKAEPSGQFKIITSSATSFNKTSASNYQEVERFVSEEDTGTFIRYLPTSDMRGSAPFLFLSQEIYSKKTEASIGMLLVMTNIQNKLDAVLEKNMQPQKFKFALLDAWGIVFAASDPDLVGQYFDPLTQKQRENTIRSGQLGKQKLASNYLTILNKNDPPFFEFIFKGKAQIAYRSFISEQNMSLIGYCPKQIFFGEALLHFLVIYAIYGLILIIGGAVTCLLALWISHPLRQLSYVMGEVSQGNLNVRFHEEPWGFDINLLGRIFNSTLDSLLKNIQKAEEERVKKETYQRELAIGRQVQRSLLPLRLPAVTGADVAGTYLPASEVGGDFFAYLSKTTESGEKVLVLCVADTSGRGISSCFYSLSARSLFRTYSTLSDNVGEILSLANNAFVHDAGDSGMFVTMVLGMYHTDSKIFSYYSCGHVPGFVRRADGEIVTLAHMGLALGLKETDPYTPSSIQLGSGDIVILYTDGLIEAMSEQNQKFSQERLKSILKKGKWKTAQEVLDTLTAEVKEFTSSTPQEEEVIIVALKVL